MRQMPGEGVGGRGKCREKGSGDEANAGERARDEANVRAGIGRLFQNKL